MSKTDDRTTPFLVHTEPPKGKQLVFNQVELRDYFAAAALQGMLASNEKGNSNFFSETSYRIADAMLKAREVKP